MPESHDPPDGPQEVSSNRDPADRYAAKRERLLEELNKGGVRVMGVFLDARTPGVSVPGTLAGTPDLTLNLSYQFPHSAMVINERGVAATLHFSGRPFRCIIPWSAVWGMCPKGAESLYVWHQDLPRELGGQESEDMATPAVEEPSLPQRPMLRMIKLDPPPEGQPSSDGPEGDGPQDVRAEPSRLPTHEPMSDEAGPGESRQQAPWLRIVR